MTIYFKGAENSNNILQSLVMAPYADVNANMVSDRDATVGEGAVNAAGSAYVSRRYDIEEYGPTEVLDGSYPDLDPGGVKPAPNSAKILSANIKGYVDNPPQEEFFDLNNPAAIFAPGASIESLNVGCAYEGFIFKDTGETWYQPTPPPPTMYPFFKAYNFGIPLECPDDKFAYLMGGLNASVTDEFVPGKGLKVIVHPGKIIASSFDSFAKVFGTTSYQPVVSGIQIMRMRYEENPQTGLRTEPIIGWINEGEDGVPTLDVDVDLYVDAPRLEEGIPLIGKDNLQSYPISFTLSGPVTFLDDGRMMVEQFNTNSQTIDLVITTTAGQYVAITPLILPEGGTRIQYISDSIK
jgi:hypothetical protein